MQNIEPRSRRSTRPPWRDSSTTTPRRQKTPCSQQGENENIIRKYSHMNAHLQARLSHVFVLLFTYFLIQISGKTWRTRCRPPPPPKQPRGTPSGRRLVKHRQTDIYVLCSELTPIFYLSLSLSLLIFGLSPTPNTTTNKQTNKPQHVEERLQQQQQELGAQAAEMASTAANAAAEATAKERDAAAEGEIYMYM